jgi:predicted component of type VI protein secretion system
MWTLPKANVCSLTNAVSNTRTNSSPIHPFFLCRTLLHPRPLLTHLQLHRFPILPSNLHLALATLLGDTGMGVLHIMVLRPRIV